MNNNNYKQPRTNFNIDLNIIKVEKKEKYQHPTEKRVNIDIKQKIKKYK